MPKSFNHRMVKSNPWGWSTMKYELKHNSMSDENIAYLELYFINSWLVIDINNFTKIKNYIDGGQRTHSKILSALYLFLNITLVTKSPCVTSESIRYQRGLYVLTGFRTPSSYFCDVIQGCQTGQDALPNPPYVLTDSQPSGMLYPSDQRLQAGVCCSVLKYSI